MRFGNFRLFTWLQLAGTGPPASPDVLMDSYALVNRWEHQREARVGAVGVANHTLPLPLSGEQIPARTGAGCSPSR